MRRLFQFLGVIALLVTTAVVAVPASSVAASNVGDNFDLPWVGEMKISQAYHGGDGLDLIHINGAYGDVSEIDIVAMGSGSIDKWDCNNTTKVDAGFDLVTDAGVTFTYIHLDPTTIPWSTIQGNNMRVSKGDYLGKLSPIMFRSNAVSSNKNRIRVWENGTRVWKDVSLFPQYDNNGTPGVLEANGTNPETCGHSSSGPHLHLDVPTPYQTIVVDDYDFRRLADGGDVWVGNVWESDAGLVGGDVVSRAFGDVNGDGADDLVLQRGSTFFVDWSANGSVNSSFVYGNPGDEAHVANVDGNGGDDLVLKRGATFFVDIGTNGSGPWDYSFNLGNPGDVALFGDVNGDGADDLVLQRGSTFFVDWSANGSVNSSFVYGSAGDLAFLANVDGAGGDDLVLKRGNQFFVDIGTNGSGPWDYSFNLGNPGDTALFANVNGAGGDDLVLKRGSTFFVDTGANGSVNSSFVYGNPGDAPFLGNVDGSGGADLVLKRSATFFVDIGTNGSGPWDYSFNLGNPGDVVVAR